MMTDAVAVVIKLKSIIKNIMLKLKDNSNKHKVAFYIMLVILLVTLRQCQSHIINATEVISNSSQDLPKNIRTDVNVIRSYGSDTSVTERLQEVRELLRSLIFDWNLGESEIEKGRTFGRIRMMRNILVPAAFLGGFLTAVILGIKAIGIVNMFLISGVLALNFALVIGKLLFAKKLHGEHGHSQNHYHSHYNQFPSHHGSFLSSHGWNDRTDPGSPYGRNFDEVPTYPPVFQPPSTFQNHFNHPSIMTALNGYHQPQQPPTNYQPQLNNYNNPFSGIHMQTPQQIQQQPQRTAFDIHDFSHNHIQSAPKTTQLTSVDTNHQEIKADANLSPQEMEKILTDALARISDRKLIIPTTAVPKVFRFKRKSTDHQHRYINLLRPFR